MPCPMSKCAGPNWSTKMKGPTIVRALLGKVRRTSKAPRSWVEEVMMSMGQSSLCNVSRVFSVSTLPVFSVELGSIINTWHSPSSARSEEHTSELQSLMRISYAVFCLKKKTIETNDNDYTVPHTLIYKT